MEDVTVNLDTGIVDVEVKAETMVDALELFPQLVAAVKGAGFEAEPSIPGL